MKSKFSQMAVRFEAYGGPEIDGLPRRFRFQSSQPSGVDTDRLPTGTAPWSPEDSKKSACGLQTHINTTRGLIRFSTDMRAPPFHGDTAADPVGKSVRFQRSSIVIWWGRLPLNRHCGRQPTPNRRPFETRRSCSLGMPKAGFAAALTRMDVNGAETMLEIGHKCCVISGERTTHGGHRH